MGTPEFAVPCLDMLIKEGYDVRLVVTQPDKPKGRGNKLSCCPVKEYAVKKGLQIFQPEKIKKSESVNFLKSFDIDIFVTAAYGQLLSQEILDVPKKGCINVHASLLPKYRGAAPINWAIINGEKTSGITTMLTDIGLDTGDILLKQEFAITENMTAGELHDKLSIIGADLLKQTLNKLSSGSLSRISQNDNDSSYAPILKKEMGKIDWNKKASDIHNLVRGINPWPGAFTYYKGTKIKIWKTVAKSKQGDDSCIPCSSIEHPHVSPGIICKADKNGIDIATSNGILRILELQLEGSKRMSAEQYLCGHKMNEGEILG